MPLDIETLRRAANADPDDTILRYALGRKLLEEDGSPAALDEARAHLAVVRERDERNVAGWYAYAQVLERLGRADEARAVLEDARRQIATRTDIDGTDLLPEIEAMLEELAP